MVFCGNGGTATVCGGVGAAGVAAGVLAGAFSWAAVSAGGVSFLVLLLVVVVAAGGFFGVAWAWTRLRQAFLDVVLFSVLQ